MQNDADRIIAEILHADTDFLAEVGRLTLLFSRIEDSFVHDALELVKLSSDEALKAEPIWLRVAELRILDKRDLDLRRSSNQL